jgi:RecA-family ATPase
MSDKKRKAQVIYMDKVEPVSVKWLVYPLLPIGKISQLIGDPGLGKSTMALHIAAMLSHGKAVFGSEGEPLQGKTLYLSGEDNANDTLKPRLMAMGADDSQVAIVENIGNDILADNDILEDAVFQVKPRFVVIDPLTHYVGKDMDMSRASDMRRLTSSLSAIAEKYECSFLVINHLNKAKGGKNLYRGLGSIDIAASARSVMMLERSENDPDIRILQHIKSSLAPEGRALAFRIDKDSIINFLGKYDDISDDELNEPEETKRKHAMDVLKGLLSGGPMPSAAVQRACSEAGISESTVNRAKKEMGVRSIRKADVWYWTLD